MALCHSITPVCLISYIWPSVHILHATSVDITWISRLLAGFFLCVPYILYMTSSIPDSISSEALEDLMSDAKTALPVTPMKDADSQTQVSRVVDAIEELSNEWGTVFSYKLIADYCIHQLFQHRKEVATQYFKEGNEQVSGAWSRDAGQFQVMGATLRNILCGPDDFLTPTED